MFSFMKFQGVVGKKEEKKMDARREPAIHHISDSMEDLDSELSNSEYTTYTVHIPPTPDNQPGSMELSTSAAQLNSSSGSKDQFVSSSLFTGGHNSVTRAFTKEKMIESGTSHSQIGGLKGSFCVVPGCNSRIMTNSQGEDVLPCDCDFKICRDCYRDELRTGDGICPGCKEAYGQQDYSEMAVDNKQSLNLEKRLSLVKSAESSLPNEFDYTHFLYESKKSYGYGNAVWPKDAENGEDNGGVGGEPKVFSEKQWKPLTRKWNVSAVILSPYRYAISSFFLPFLPLSNANLFKDEFSGCLLALISFIIMLNMFFFSGC